MTDWSDLPDAMRRQAEFSGLFFDADALTTKQKEEILKTFVLSLHSEATGMVDGINYKDHRRQNNPVDIQKILYKSVDAYRYILATLNLWGISPNEFATALSQKDDFLHYRHALKDNVWKGQPVVLFDLDDVLAEFRSSWCEFVTELTGVFIDPWSSEYYNASVFKEHGLNNDFLFRTFVSRHGFLGLERNDKYYSLMCALKERGCWIQVLTARPASDATAFYDTYSWLSRHAIPADGVAFTAEKFTWLADQSFYHTARVIAIDDSPKHSAEYVKHGVPVVVPQKSYNFEMKGVPNVFYTPQSVDPLQSILSVLL